MTDAWEPANDVERALMLAMAGDDRQGFFQVVGAADLYLPQLHGDESQQQFVTVHAFEQTFLPVFTSVEALAANLGHAIDGYVVTNYSELRRKWPHPDWRVALNPGTPLDAYFGIEAVEGAATGDTPVPTIQDLYLGAAEDLADEERLRALYEAGDYPDDREQALLAASAAGDVYGLLERLLDGTVLVPTTRPVPAEQILDDDFPWAYASDGVIEVFAGPTALLRSHPAGAPPHVEVALPFALAMWPEDRGLRVNPGGKDTIELPPEQVGWLLTFSAPDEEPAG